MALKFRTCSECREEHALRADGRMSVHATASGVRCEEPAASATSLPTAPVSARRGPRRPREGQGLEPYEVAVAEVRRQKRELRGAGNPLHGLSDELERLGGDIDPKGRTLYGVSGLRVVRGGAPGGGKRR